MGSRQLADWESQRQRRTRGVAEGIENQALAACRLTVRRYQDARLRGADLHAGRTRGPRHERHRAGTGDSGDVHGGLGHSRHIEPTEGHIKRTWREGHGTLCRRMIRSSPERCETSVWNVSRHYGTSLTRLRASRLWLSAAQIQIC
jgi:hypothetical protein